ncbi:MAG: M56 family metallopeptidase [Planctomycetota bacterium]
MAAEHLDAALLAWLSTYFVHSTLLLAAAWILARVVARSRRFTDSGPAIRESLWRVALLAPLATATLQRGLGVDGPASLWAIETRAAATTQTLDEPNAPADSGASEKEFVAAPQTGLTAERHSATSPTNTDAVPSVRRIPIVPVVFPTAVVFVPRETASHSFARSNGANESPTATLLSAAASEPDDVEPAPADERSFLASISWSRALLTLWLLGIAAGAASWLREWRGLRRRLEHRVVLDRGRVHDAFARLCERTNTSGVELTCAPALCAPITLGLVRAEIAIPPRATTQLSPDELDALFAHELAHVRRGDPLWLVLYRALEVVFFFQPLNRIARVRLVDEAELLADDWAATQLESRVSLASCLTEIAGWIVHERRLLPAPAMAARGTRLSVRVHRLLDEGHHPENARRPSGLLLLAGSAVAGVALFGPGVAATRIVEDELAPRTDDAWETSTRSPFDAPAEPSKATALDDGTPSVGPAEASPSVDSTGAEAISSKAELGNASPTTTEPARALADLASEIDALRRAAEERELTPELAAELAELVDAYDALANEMQALEALLERLDATPNPAR